MIHYTFLNGLTVVDMEDLLEDIQVQRELGQGKNVDFWQDRTTISENEIVIRPPTPNLVDSGKGQATP